MQTNKQLDLAYDFVQYTGQNIFLTGKAGTGKTTFLKNLRGRLPKRMVVVAPTGVAAINAGGVTIHSFFQLSFAPQIGAESKFNTEQRFTKEKVNIMRTLDLLVIDEISMVRVDILDAIDRTLRRFKNSRKPFGGVQVLMIGDLQQLAPVVKNEEWGLLKHEYDTPYFFSSRVLKEFPYVKIELTEVFRQQDERFITILNKVRDNKLDDAARKELNQRYIPNFSPRDDDGYITLCTHNISAHRINDSKLLALKGKTYIFPAKVEGKFPEYSYPTDFELKIKPGVQVMFVKNDPGSEKQYYNGKIGRVTRIENDTVWVQCPGEEHEIEVETQTWENYKYSIDKETGEIREEIEGAFSQIPLKLAWAITIHKSQGLTFEKAIIDAEASFAHGQVYVALSRCKTLEGMVLSSPVGNRSIINDKTVNGFIKEIKEKQPGENELLTAKRAFQKEQLTEIFRFYRISWLLHSIVKVVQENRGSFIETIALTFEKMQKNFESEVVEVAAKFYEQITNYIRLEPDVDKNHKLQERVKKAATYFGGKVKNILSDSLDNMDMDIDNKAVKKQMKKYTNDLKNETEIKQTVFEVCVDGFDVKRIMEATAHKIVKLSTNTNKHSKKAREITDFEHIPHPDVFNRLRAFRTEKARELSCPPFMIFSQKVLYELVNYLPTDSTSLKMINGMGNRKIEQFGIDITEIIRQYCAENNIAKGEIPLKEEKKEKKPKIDTKRLSFELFQSGKTVGEIAKERTLTTGTIEGHLAHFVRTGELKINRLVNDEEKLKKIVAFFDQAETKNLGEAKKYFGNEASYGELRGVLNYMERQKKNEEKVE